MSRIRGNAMKCDCQMVEEVATFSDSGVILTRLDVSRALENDSFILTREINGEVATQGS
jgi:hypothetical protein